MLGPIGRLKSTNGLTRFVTVVLVLTGFAAIIGVIVAVGTLARIATR